ncbi:MAG: ABC transporter permease [Clostridia bacterium]|nr:ABC transporter permease [Clostridia bacterium]MBQ6172121.1 ABC transporter permease [Clostridia bacterium]
MTKVSRIIYLTAIFVFTYLPIFVLIVFSFNSGRSTGVWEGFSLKWYEELINDARIQAALLTTIIVALSSAVISTVFGTVSAIGIFYMKKMPKNIIMNITNIPILNADIITGVSLLLLYNILGIDLGYASLIIAHISFNIPYVILSVMPKLKQMDNNIYEAALDLGATPTKALVNVIVPQIMPGIVSGFLLALTMSMDDFVISLFTSGPVVSTLSLEIYSMTKRGITPEINALSTIIFVIVIAVLLISNLKNPQADKKKRRA